MTFYKKKYKTDKNRQKLNKNANFEEKLTENSQKAKKCKKNTEKVGKFGQNSAPNYFFKRRAPYYFKA